MSANQSDTALLVIDVQIEMLEGDLVPYQPDTMIANINALLNGARESGTPVIYVRHNEPEYEPMSLGNPRWHVHPAIAPQPGEPIIDKQTPDSFHETNLQEVLQSRGIEKLVVTGMQTENCVEATCRRAIALDYDVVLVTDAHSTYDSDSRSAGQIIADTNADLAALTGHSHRIVAMPTAEVTFAAE